MRPARFSLVSLVPIVAILAAASAGADDGAWSVRVWQSDGLPDRHINGVVQSADGFLWLITTSNLARFDGARFEAYSTRDLAPRSTRALLQDTRGRLWLALNRAPAVILEPGRPPIHVPGLPELSADTIVEDDEGAIWIAYHEGAVARIKHGAVTSFGSASGLVEGTAVELSRDNGGRIWYAQAGQVGLFSDGTFRPLLRLPNLALRLTAAREGGVWIGSGHRLFRYDAGGSLVERGSLPDANRGARMEILLEGKDGDLWIGTRHDGLFRLSASGIETVPSSHPDIRCLMEDREGNLWVGTGGGGLNRVQPRVVEAEGGSTGLPSQLVQSVTQDAEGALWATTRNGLLARRTKDGWQTVPLGKDQPGATCLAADPSGALWIGTRGRRLHRLFKGRLTTFGRDEGFEIHTACSMVVSRSGDVWIAGESPAQPNLRADVQRLHGGRFETMALPTGTRATRAMVEDRQGAIWIGGERGRLLRSNGGPLHEEASAAQAVQKQIRALHATPDGGVWIGYDNGGGLARWKDGRFAQLGHDQGLPGLTVAQVAHDALGSVWLGTDLGLFKLPQRELDAAMEARSAHVRPVQIGARDASFTVSASECGWTGALLSRDGALWIPMGTALLIAHPDRLPADPLPPPVRLTRVTVDGQIRALYSSVHPGPSKGPPPVDLRQATEVTVLPGDRRLEIEFTAPTFRAPDNLRFRYRLDDFDEDWIDAGNERVARYGPLPAGHYRFRVSPCPREGACDEGGAALDVHVAPLFWQTWWFRLGSLAAFTGALVATVRYASFRRLRRSLALLQEQAALDRERTRIARDIHDDVGNRLNRITLLSELALQDGAAPGQMTAQVREISSAVREVIGALDEVVWAVSPRHDTLPHLVSRIGQFAMEHLRTAGIRCELELPSHPPDWPLSAEVRHNVFCAVKEAVTNLVRHARARAVKLRVDIGLDSFAIVIEDDGQGFEARPPDPGADGLHNMEQRMTEIGGRMSVTSSPGQGTRVSLSLPRPRTRS